MHEAFSELRYLGSQYVKEKKRDKKDIAALSRGSNALSRAFNASNTRAHRASDEARKPSSEAGLSLDSLSNKADIASGASDRYALGRMLKKDNDLTRACQHFQGGVWHSLDRWAGGPYVIT